MQHETGETGMATFPGDDWDLGEPDELGFDGSRLASVGKWQMEDAGDRPYRALVVRHGKIAAEWNSGLAATETLSQASASKSTYACVLGVAVEEGVIGSADDRVVDYYPEMMDVPPGRGPKEGRHVFPENREITFRQLIGNTSGYMKPGELPGKQFHYQTYGMNILTHALAARYGLYETSDPEGSPSFGKLAEEKIRDPIGGTWGYKYSNFKLQANANLPVFGYYTNFLCTARDMARLGLLWLHDGEWDGRQVVPKQWMREITRTSDMVTANEPKENWRYGLGFWTNDHGVPWPDLPRDSFAACGAGRQRIWVCPSLEIVVVQSPGTFNDRPGMAPVGPLVDRVLAAIT